MEKAKIAAKEPKMVELKQGETYAWCSCGKSTNQPFCNGSHMGSSFNPTIFNVDETVQAALCQCKQTKNPPYCDGSHMNIEA